jgi:hypothetical protein
MSPVSRTTASRSLAIKPDISSNSVPGRYSIAATSTATVFLNFLKIS